LGVVDGRVHHLGFRKESAMTKVLETCQHLANNIGATIVALSWHGVKMENGALSYIVPS